MILNDPSKSSVASPCSGVAIGAGWQALVAYINLGCYYIFGLPLGIVLGYVAKFGVKVLFIVSKIILCYDLFCFISEDSLDRLHLGALGRNDCRDCDADIAAAACSVQNQLEQRSK